MYLDADVTVRLGYECNTDAETSKFVPIYCGRHAFPEEGLHSHKVQRPRKTKICNRNWSYRCGEEGLQQ